MRPPMPQTAVTGRSPMVSIHVRRVSVATPPGLANPVAVLACSLVSPIPTEHRSPVAANTRRLKPTGERLRVVGRTPTNASSQPHTSTTTPSDRSVAMTSSDAAS